MNHPAKDGAVVGDKEASEPAVDGNVGVVADGKVGGEVVSQDSSNNSKVADAAKPTAHPVESSAGATQTTAKASTGRDALLPSETKGTATAKDEPSRPVAADASDDHPGVIDLTMSDTPSSSGANPKVQEIVAVTDQATVKQPGAATAGKEESGPVVNTKPTVAAAVAEQPVQSTASRGDSKAADANVVKGQAESATKVRQPDAEQHQVVDTAAAASLANAPAAVRTMEVKDTAATLDKSDAKAKSAAALVPEPVVPAVATGPLAKPPETGEPQSVVEDDDEGAPLARVTQSQDTVDSSTESADKTASIVAETSKATSESKPGPLAEAKVDSTEKAGRSSSIIAETVNPTEEGKPGLLAEVKVDSTEKARKSSSISAETSKASEVRNPGRLAEVKVNSTEEAGKSSSTESKPGLLAEVKVDSADKTASTAAETFDPTRERKPDLLAEVKVDSTDSADKTASTAAETFNPTEESKPGLLAKVKVDSTQKAGKSSSIIAETSKATEVNNPSLLAEVKTVVPPDANGHGLEVKTAASIAEGIGVPAASAKSQGAAAGSDSGKVDDDSKSKVAATVTSGENTAATLANVLSKTTAEEKVETASAPGDSRKRPLDEISSRESKRRRTTDSPVDETRYIPTLPVKKEVVVRKSRVNLEGIKIMLYSAGSRVHGISGYEGRFAAYWKALSMRLEGKMSETETAKCQTVVDAFLRTKKLRRLHNKLILGKSIQSAASPFYYLTMALSISNISFLALV